MGAEADMEGSPEGQLPAVAQRLDASEDVESTADGSLSFVLVGAWVAEVGQHAVTEVLGDVALVSSHRVPTNPLVGRDQLAEVLGIEQLRQHRGSHYVAEQHGELAALTPRVLVLQPGAATATELRFCGILKAAYRTCWA